MQSANVSEIKWPTKQRQSAECAQHSTRHTATIKMGYIQWLSPHSILRLKYRFVWLFIHGMRAMEEHMSERATESVIAASEVAGKMGDICRTIDCDAHDQALVIG